MWNSKSQIASLAFHPVDRLLAIATYNEVHFWDWNDSQPFTFVTTKSHREKVRSVFRDCLVILKYYIYKHFLQLTNKFSGMLLLIVWEEN